MTGYSLVELLVVGAIIGVLSVIVIVGQGAFNRTLLLANTASDIALSLHSTQSFGIGSRTVGTVGNAGYGLDFSISNPNSYAFFADLNPAASCTKPNCRPGNGFYTSLDTIVQTYVLNNGMTISNFCAIIPPSTTYCKTGGTNAVEHVSIVFARPYTFATIGAGAIGSGATSVSGVPFTEACIAIMSPHSTYRYLRVTRVGHITTTTSCP